VTTGAPTASATNDRFAGIEVVPNQDAGGYQFGERGLSMQVVSLRLCLSTTPPKDEIYEYFIGTYQRQATPPDSSAVISTPDTAKKVTITGTAGDDQIEFIAGSGTSGKHKVVINGTAREFTTAEATRFAFDGRDGHDTIRITGTEAIDVLELGPDSGTLGSPTLASPTYAVDLAHMEDVFADGGAGQDEAKLTGSSGDDLVRAQGKFAALWGDDFLKYAFGFEKVKAVGGDGDNRKDVDAVDFTFETEGTWLAR